MISRPHIKNLRSRNQPSKRSQLLVTRMFFLSLLSRTFDDRLSSNFHRFVILCICWDTPTVKASLWQLPIVPTAFNQLGLIQLKHYKLWVSFYLYLIANQMWLILEKVKHPWFIPFCIYVNTNFTRRISI